MSFFRKISPDLSTDDELVAKYKATSELRVLSELYLRYMELVYGVCLKYFKDEEESKDAVQNIFEELIAKLHKYPVTHFKAWLHQLAKNHCLMKMRSDKKFSKVEIDVYSMQNEDSEHLNNVMDKETHFSHLDFCIQQLAVEQKQVIALFYLEEKCYNEITILTGMEWKKVRSFIQNGRRNLKICMEKQLNVS